jgi:hypothetical protein
VSRFQFVADHSTIFEAKRLCELVEAGRSSLYARRAAAPAPPGAGGSSADNALAESFNATLKREILQDAACWA